MLFFPGAEAKLGELGSIDEADDTRFIQQEGGWGGFPFLGVRRRRLTRV